MKKMIDSKAMLEVWKWKEEAANEVKDLPLKKALLKRLHDSESVSNKLGLKSVRIK